MYKKFTFFCIIFLSCLNIAHSAQKIEQIDRFNFNFKIYFNSYIHSETSNKALDFKKSKLAFSYKLNDELEFNTSFLYSKKNKFEFDVAHFDYHINDHSVLYIGNVRSIFNMYFEKSENYLSIIIPTVNRATSFFTKAQGLGLIYKNNFNDNFTFHLSAIGKNINNSNDDSNILTIRTFYFNENSDNILHIGLNNNFIYNDKMKRKDKNINNVYYDFSIRRLNSTGIELATRLKNFTLESEIFYTKINPFAEKLKGKYFDVYNFYSEISYVLTGEVKIYDKLNGVIKKLKVKNPISNGGIGTIESVVRYQFTNAISNKNDYSMDLGRHKILLFGLNWLPTNCNKILLSYSKIKSNYKIRENKNNDEFKIEYRFFW